MRGGVIMGYFDSAIERKESLAHHGIKGQHWGVRRFQNQDGSLKPAGKGRYDGDAVSLKAAGHKALAKVHAINEKAYAKSNKTLSSMNEAAKKAQLKKAEEAQKEANAKRDAKKAAADAKKEENKKLTMHDSKDTMLLGGNKYQNHKEFVKANKFAKETYKKRKEEIKEEKKNSNDNFVSKNVKALAKNLDNKAQYRYELDRNRANAGVSELKRGAAAGAAKGALKGTAAVGAGVLASYLAVNVANAALNRANGGVSKSKNAIATLNANKVDQHYEFEVGKKEVAKYLAKTVAVGALYGAANEFSKTYDAKARINRTKRSEKAYGVTNTREKRAEKDEEKWKKGEV